MHGQHPHFVPVLGDGVHYSDPQGDLPPVCRAALVIETFPRSSKATVRVFRPHGDQEDVPEVDNGTGEPDTWHRRDQCPH